MRESENEVLFLGENNKIICFCKHTLYIAFGVFILICRLKVYDGNFAKNHLKGIFYVYIQTKLAVEGEATLFPLGILES